MIAAPKPRYRWVEFLATFAGTPLDGWAARQIDKQTDALLVWLNSLPQFDQHINDWATWRSRLTDKAADLFTAVHWASNDDAKWAQVKYVYAREGVDLSGFDSSIEAAEYLATLRR